jgi:hypothetical protein
MFNRQTLFVLGAGASEEVGLPIGTNLIERIRNKMDIRFEGDNKPIGTGEISLFNRITNNTLDEAFEYQKAAWLIRDGISLSQSIDDFLDLHRENRRVNLLGKAAVVQSILQVERKSKLHPETYDGIFSPHNFANTWFVKFMHMLSRGVSKENVREIFDRV